MRKRNLRIAVFGATYAMALLMMPTKITVNAAAQFAPEEMVIESISMNNYYEETIRSIASEVFDTYTSSAEKRNADDSALLEELEELEQYKNIGIANVEDHLNIRANADQNAEVIGTLAKNAGCSIEKVEKNGWVKITSGDVTGYVQSSYLITGDEIPSLVKEVGKKIGTVNTETVRLRESKSTDGITLDLLGESQTVDVLDDSDDTWVKVRYNGDKGFIAKEFLEINYELKQATAVEKEEATSTTQEAAPSKDTVKENVSSNKTTSSNKTNSNKTNSNKTNSNKTNVTVNNSSTSTSSIRSNIVSYAKQFLGNKYVYGGTSLTSGVDCSGFTMSVYQKFGYNITRTSRTQASAGKSISVSSVKPGDLLFYAKGGSINHVAMYIGGGRVIHASNPSDGIKISNMNYRTPCKAARFIND